MSYNKVQILVGFFILIIIVVGAIASGFKNSKPVSESVDIVEKGAIIQNSIIGKSVEGRDIKVFQFGRQTDIEKVQNHNSDTKHLLLVGGIHGGYEWNSVLLAEKFTEYFAENLSEIP
jgi:hypothetical protein